MRSRPIFNHALQSFKDTIRPNAHNAQLIRSARAELASILSMPPHASTARNDDMAPHETRNAESELTAHNPDPYLAVHIRRGDRHASSFPYRGKYVPLENYVDAARDAWSRLYNEDVFGESANFPAPPIVYVASDSHATAHDFVSAFPASTAVFSLDSSTDPALRGLAPQHEYVQQEFNRMELEDRVRLTRGMVVDLAMLSGLWAWEGDVVPGATICTLRYGKMCSYLCGTDENYCSSTICRLSAVGHGFDRAFGFDDGKAHPSGSINDKTKRWIELDNRGNIAPSWTAFEVFA